MAIGVPSMELHRSSPLLSGGRGIYSALSVWLLMWSLKFVDVEWFYGHALFFHLLLIWPLYVLFDFSRRKYMPTEEALLCPSKETSGDGESKYEV
jgi:hypothetical protein